MRKLAKTLFTAVAAIFFTLGMAYLRFRRLVEGEIDELLERARGQEAVIVTPDMLAGLPAPVQRYLTYSGVVGKPMARTVRLRQVGRIRQDEGEPWMDFTAEEYYTVSPPGFVWRANVKSNGLPLVQGRDKYTCGTGHMLIKLASVFPIVDATGEEMDQGALIRYLNEMMWFPSAYLGRNVTWKGVSDNSAEVTLVDAGHSVTAMMYFDDIGRLTNFVAPRYRMVDGRYTLETWSTPIREYGKVNGYHLPVFGDGVWNLSSGDLSYIEVRVLEIDYNISRRE